MLRTRAGIHYRRKKTRAPATGRRRGSSEGPYYQETKPIYLCVRGLQREYSRALRNAQTDFTFTLLSLRREMRGNSIGTCLM
jgi:hypothetical protein